MIYQRPSHLGSYFPDYKNISDIILQLGGVLREKIEAGKITIHLDDTLVLTETDFNTILLEVRKRFKAGWYKTYREMALDKLLREVMETMISWKMLAWDEDLRAVKILAMVGKFIGSYPRNFGKGEDTDER